jgi:hypothetical protein
MAENLLSAFFFWLALRLFFRSKPEPLSGALTVRVTIAGGDDRRDPPPEPRGRARATNPGSWPRGRNGHELVAILAAG